MLAGIQAHLMLDAHADAGESPWWSEREGKLYWVDIHGRALHRFDPATTHDEQWSAPDLLTFVAEHVDGGLVMALADAITYAPAPGAPLRRTMRIEVPRGGRLNDGAIDSRGRLWIGAMTSPDAPTATANLYCIDLDGTCRIAMQGFRTVNGLAFSPDGRTLYISDSHPLVRTVWRADYDVQHGAVGEREVFIDTHGLPGRPDGGCVDADGAYWMAAVDGGAILRFAAEGQLIGRVHVETAKPSKAAFGGPDLGTMFITSLRRNLPNADPHAGGIFAARPGPRGVMATECRIDVTRWR